MNLKKSYGKKYRIETDESYEAGEDPMWYQRIPCEWGHIYVHGVRKLGAFVEREKPSPTIQRLLDAGCQLHQRGDHEFTVTFGSALFAKVARIVKPTKLVQMSPERKKALAERLGR